MAQIPERSKKNEKAPVDSRPLELNPLPEHIVYRIPIFDQLKAQFDQEISQKPRKPIHITLNDGSVKEGEAWVTSPATIARDVGKSFFERAIVARVNGELWDLTRPLEGDCKLEILEFEHPEGKKVFWHSSAHMLGEAAERRYGCFLSHGPPTDDGFFYDMALPDNGVVQQADWKPLDTIVSKIAKEKQPFERLVVSKDKLLEIFKHNKYKIQFISEKIPDGTSSTVYRCGDLIDLCLGPHVPHTGYVKVMEVTKNSASYFGGDAKNDSLQRIYGISFPAKKQLAEHKLFVEEAERRNHRKIGKEQELFMFNDKSPGSCFFLPHGTTIYNTLEAFLKEEYRARGYDEVKTPNMFDADLWRQSGHWQHYKDDMFTFLVEKKEWALKPMNCPSHCLIFDWRERSYRELPIRMADFGVLHRNEASGALSGLTRVRRFQQDDTHIFCTENQIEQEILGLFDFLETVYRKTFGFDFRMRLSTRPENFLGEIATWDLAEEKLRNALDAFTAQKGKPWELNPQDGAFYGPKIDITISDALKREHQCATIQLDFQLPQRFNLRYVTGESSGKPQADGVDARPNGVGESHSLSEPDHVESGKPQELPAGYARPVMIHRAIYGSFERFIAILIEHFAGKWPFWLNPRQVLVVPVMPAANEYAKEVTSVLRGKKILADADVSGEKMAKKIRTGQLAQYSFIFVVGAQEQESRTVNIRDRDDPATQAKGEMISLDDAIAMMKRLRKTRALSKLPAPAEDLAKAAAPQV